MTYTGISSSNIGCIKPWQDLSIALNVNHLCLGVFQFTSTQECANDFIQHDASTALYYSILFCK